MINFTNRTLTRGYAVTLWGPEVEVLAYLESFKLMYGEPQIVYHDSLPVHYKKSKTLWYVRFGAISDFDNIHNQNIHLYLTSKQQLTMAVLAQ